MAAIPGQLTRLLCPGDLVVSATGASRLMSARPGMVHEDSNPVVCILYPGQSALVVAYTEGTWSGLDEVLLLTGAGSLGWVTSGGLVPV